MWKRFADQLRCPKCSSSLELVTILGETASVSAEQVGRAAAMGIGSSELSAWVQTGALCCNKCSLMYPVVNGLPVLIPYTTPIHHEFVRDNSLQYESLAKKYRFPESEPVAGERFVMNSFSTEWLAYDFDGVIWEMNYEDHQKRFLAELGAYAPPAEQGPFLEIGCGIGITTAMAQENFGGDAVGVDLGLAALRATIQYRSNPFLHFAQASAFYLPLERKAYQTVYSRGVLHHTYSTELAFRNMAECCAPRGTCYLWVYGPGSIKETPFRRIAYAFERPIRWLISRNASGVLAKLLLAPIATGYMVFNFMRRQSDPTIQPYNFQRAMHAARDRFTPEFAHRHDKDEVSAWFRNRGFESIEVVNWLDMPSADYDDYRRNTGVRAKKPGGAPVMSHG